MVLTTAEAIKRLNAPVNAGAIQLARNQTERLVMHGENILEKYSLPFLAYRNFQMWWQSLVHKEKYVQIESLITTPLATVPLVDDIFVQIGKYRDAQDRYIAFDFTVKDYTNDFNDFLKSSNDEYFWNETCLEGIRTGVNDIVVIDLPFIQKSLRPEPYQYLVSPMMFHDVVINKFNGNIEYFIFKQNDFKWDDSMGTATTLNLKYQNMREMCKYIVVDDESYRIFIKPSISLPGEDWVEFAVSKHNLGYCPCTSLWKPAIKGTQGINKKGICTKLLSKLDKFLLYSALADYMDISGSYPMFVTYAMEEEQWDDKRKQVNFGDYYAENTSTYNSGQGQQAKNPRTNYLFMNAPGTVIEYPQPADGQDANFVANPPRWVNMPVEALKQVRERIKELESEIYEYATGECSEYMNEIAKNTEMFDASFSHQDTILTFVKRQMEQVHRFVIKTKAELRYGKEYFIGATIDYGSDFMLKNSNEIVTEFKEAKDAGMPTEYISAISKEAANTRFRNNPEVLARQRIMMDIIPYQNMSFEQLVSTGVKDSDTENYVIRINSTNFVSRFEQEWGDIVKFGSTLSYADKVDTIKQTFKEYGKQLKWQPTGANTGAGEPKTAGGV